jgi:hypothetical protein
VYHLGFVRRFAGKELIEEYSKKWTKFKGGKKLLVWATISFDGPELLYFIDGKKNTDVYEEIVDECLPVIPKLQSGQYIFQQDNAAPHAAF